MYEIHTVRQAGPVFSYKLRYIVGFWLVEMAISTNQKPTIYRNLYENTAADTFLCYSRKENKRIFLHKVDTQYKTWAVERPALKTYFFQGHLCLQQSYTVVPVE